MIIDDVLNEALQLYKPSQEEKRYLMDLANIIIHQAKECSLNYNGILKITLEGSLAKKTWIRGREEVDIFIHHDSKIPREEMEKQIIEIGFKILKELNSKPKINVCRPPVCRGLCTEFVFSSPSVGLSIYTCLRRLDA